MTASNIQITAGSGTRLATNSYSEGGQTVHDEKFIPGEYPYPSYVVRASLVSTATSADHVVQIMAGASLNVRIKRIEMRQHAAAGSVSAGEFQILRLTTAGSGGTSITPSKMDNADSASGATAQTLPSSKGTESTIIMVKSIWWSTATIPTPHNGFLWEQHQGVKPIIIPAGTSNGIALKVMTGVASTSVTVDVEFIETSF